MAIDTIELLVKQIDILDTEINDLHAMMTGILTQHQQHQSLQQTQQAFHMCVTRISAAGVNRMVTQHNLNLAKAEREHRGLLNPPNI